MSAHCFEVPNPFGVCAVGRVAVFAASRKEAVQKIKAEGLKVARRALEPPIKLTSADLAVIETDPATVWIRGVGLHVNSGFVDHDPWRPVGEFRARYE